MITKLRLLALLAVATGALALGVTAGTAARSAATLDFTLLSEIGDHSITLGGQTGPPVCTNDASGYPIECVAPIGTSTTENASGTVRDNGTGATGTLTIACTVMYAGTQTTYAGRSGRADATGSEDCSLRFEFPGGDVVYGALHESRVLVDSTETNTFGVTMTGGEGRYVSTSGSLSFSSTNPWGAPPPIPARSTSARSRQAALLAEGIRLKLHATAGPLADVISPGLLAPRNRPVTVRVAVPKGASCTAAIAGAKAVTLPRAVDIAGKGEVRFTALPATTFGASAPWTLRTVCSATVGGKAVTLTDTQRFRSFSVLK